ncbi:hypothetical protein K2173_012742 [Erythroxylum novogranatense]|uniref:BHLH domain-containing protein n=1 Tax=Erythroxylum novogranatense TaxID=1862640 RepID=A0AAV8TTC9_9ROSI|nr:hypothetical protein K2173_012742 [Erythroxylum novogranatense]
MAGNHQPEGLGDDFFEQILAVRPIVYGGGNGVSSGVGEDVGLKLGSGGGGLRNNSMELTPLGLNLEHLGFLRQQQEEASGGLDNNNTIATANATATTTNPSPSSSTGIGDRDYVHMTALFPAFGHLPAQSIRLTAPPPTPPPGPPQTHQPQHFHRQSAPGMISSIQQPPAIRPRVRARRGQATDPHSIAERVRRERIAERMKALQELVPTTNKTDRAAMLDEIVDYVKFLRLQVKVLSMSKLGGTVAVAPLVADVPLSSIEGDGVGGGNQRSWEKWSHAGTEEQVAKLMEEDIGAAMQLLQSKSLCVMPLPLASVIFRSQPPDTSTLGKLESNPNS